VAVKLILLLAVVGAGAYLTARVLDLVGP